MDIIVGGKKCKRYDATQPTGAAAEALIQTWSTVTATAAPRAAPAARRRAPLLPYAVPPRRGAPHSSTAGWRPARAPTLHEAQPRALPEPVQRETSPSTPF